MRCGRVVRSGLLVLCGALLSLSVVGSEWTTHGNGVTHTGSAPVQFAAPVAEIWAATLATTALQQPAVAGGRVYVTPKTSSGAIFLVALNETDGAEVWRKSFDSADYLTAPTYDGGRVYVQRENHSNDSQVWCLGAADGTVVWSSPWSCQWDHYYAPLVVDGMVFTGAGYYGGLAGKYAADGKDRFWLSLEGYDEWTPAYANGRVYTWIAGKFREHDITDGTVVRSLDLGWDWKGWSMQTAPVIVGDVAYLVASDDENGSPRIHAVNIGTMTKAWEIVGPFSGTPAVVNGVLYCISKNGATPAVSVLVRSYNATTGAHIRDYTADRELVGQPIITNNCLIVTSNEFVSPPQDEKTYIFQLGNGVPYQTIAHGGAIAVAGQSLYIASNKGVLRKYRTPQVSIAASDPYATEGSAGDKGLFTITTDRVFSTDTTITYTVSGTAVAGTDYTALSGSAVILANQASATIQVTALQTVGTVSSDRSVIVTLDYGIGYHLGNASGAVYICEPRPVVTGFPSPTTAGVASSFSITMQDTTGTTITSFTGTVAFSSSDPQAQFSPASYTLVGADNGSKSGLGATLKTAGSQSISATLSGTTVSSAQSGILVQPAAASTLLVSGPSPAALDMPETFTVTAQDPYGNIATGYGGTIGFSSSQSSATLPSNSVFAGTDQGVRSFAVTFHATGTCSLTATDIAAPSITGTLSNIVVAHLPPKIVSPLTATPSPARVGQEVQFTCVASDLHPLQYTWDFGDGTVETSTATTVTHAYKKEATYTVTVTATEATGLTVSDSTTLTVTAEHICAELEPVPSGAQKVGVKLSFREPGAATITYKVSMLLNDNFNPAGQLVQYQFGRLIGSATLTEKGSVTTTEAKISLKYKKPAKGESFTARPAQLSIALKLSSLPDLNLSDVEALNATTAKTGVQTSLQCCVALIGHQAYHGTATTGVYKAIKDKGGAYAGAAQ